MFGPLHTSKKRERYKEGQYPENMDRLKISNTGRITADVSFFFRDDTNGTTYLLDPSTMTLNPGESQVLPACTCISTDVLSVTMYYVSWMYMDIIYMYNIFLSQHNMCVL